VVGQHLQALAGLRAVDGGPALLVDDAAAERVDRLGRVDGEALVLGELPGVAADPLLPALAKGAAYRVEL